ncbi:MAG: RNA polymerase sigma factor [Actinomycetota bacterium]
MDEATERAMTMLERWVRAYQPVVFRAAYLILRDTQAAEDVAQETFIRAYNAARRADPGDEVRAWLYRIAVNTALNEVRRRKRERAAIGRVRPEDGFDPMESSDRTSIVSEAIDKLPDRLRVAVICRYFLDLSESEMAQVLKVRPGTVKSRLHEARRLLAGDDALVGVAGTTG